jgi:hypothetical protein
MMDGKDGFGGDQTLSDNASKFNSEMIGEMCLG